MIDQTIDKLTPEKLLENAKAETKGWIDRAASLFEDEEDEALEDEETTAQDQSRQEDELKKAGLLEQELYPKLVAILGIVYRIFSLVINLGGLLISIYFAYSMQAVVENRKLIKEQQRLTQRVKKLEDRIEGNRHSLNKNQ
ncbi:MAG: hypothetical protein GF347_00735 [Candidatus Moranbacteria bacterium]|nr:hypothetical protein [Candidatus Moranbacteria bacterium]